MIKLVRLVSGEELLCDVKSAGGYSENKSSIRVKNILIMIPTGEGKIGVADYMPYTNINDGVDIKHSHIIFMVDAVEMMAKAHKDKFSSLLVPTSKIVL